MACPGAQKKKYDFSFASSFDNALSKDGGISIYRDRKLKNSEKSALLVIPEI
jgi:hypothetical protein